MSGLPLFSFDLGVDGNLLSIGYVEPQISPRFLLRGMGLSRKRGISPSRPKPEPVSASPTSALSSTGDVIQATCRPSRASALSSTGATRTAPGRPPSISALSSTSRATRTAPGRPPPNSALSSTRDATRTASGRPPSTSALSSTGGMNTRGGL